MGDGCFLFELNGLHSTTFVEMDVLRVNQVAKFMTNIWKDIFWGISNIRHVRSTAINFVLFRIDVYGNDDTKRCVGTVPDVKKIIIYFKSN